jgi:NAD-dependent deacetylase
MSTVVDQEEIERVRGWVEEAERVVALTGAGISTDSGIPDFRGPQGVWTKNPTAERTSSLHHYLNDPGVRRQSWHNRLHHPAWVAVPNPGHLALVELERRGKLLALVTQNIDELHQQAGSSPDVVVELHGTMRHAVCWSCGARTPMQQVLDRVQAGEEDPHCECGGILKSATISFGQSLDPEVLAQAERAASSADLLLAIGSTLSVRPAAGLVPLAWESGARVVILNAEPTPYDRIAHAVLRGSISKVLPAIVG